MRISCTMHSISTFAVAAQSAAYFAVTTVKDKLKQKSRSLWSVSEIQGAWWTSVFFASLALCKTQPVVFLFFFLRRNSIIIRIHSEKWRERDMKKTIRIRAAQIASVTSSQTGRSRSPNLLKAIELLFCFIDCSQLSHSCAAAEKLPINHVFFVENCNIVGNHICLAEAI